MEQTIKVESFEGIEIESNVTVYLKQADQQQVTIAAPQNIIDLLTTEFNGGIWEIDFSRYPKTEEKIIIYIESNNIQELTIEGSGEVFS